MNIDIETGQRELCRRFNVEFVAPPPGMKVGIALNLRDGLQPFNGLRHPMAGDTTGWYLWGGEELSEAADFFVPLHVEHLHEWRPEVIKYLGLPPGWRFLIADGHEDVWFDESLLNLGT